MKKETKMIYYFVIFFLFAIATAFTTSLFFRISSANVAIIPIHSGIGLSGSLMSGLSSDDVIGMIDDAEENPNVEVVVLSINSGGGSIVACQEVVERVKSIEKPTIAWIRDIGASGAYWVASATDYIVASKVSITGSIGVTISYLDFEVLFEKYGITYWNFTMPESKDIFTQYRAPSQDEIDIIEDILNDTYCYFIQDIAANRDISKEYLENATKKGAVISGQEAFDAGLVDYLGNKEAVEALAQHIANLTYVETKIYKVDLLEKASSLFSGLNELIIKV